VELACRALPGSRAGYYRKRAASAPPAEKAAPSDKPVGSRGPAGRALSEEERRNLLALLHSPRFCDQAPREIYATLLSEGVYAGSVSSMYRLLRDNQELKERRNQLQHRSFTKPELLATGPNQVWSWDITKLKAATKWTYYYLYVVLDIYSRYVVAWCIAPCESAELAQQLILDACLRQGISPGQLSIHADRGSAMTSKVVEQLLVDLGVTKTHSRPHVSNDNPYSEAQFKTLKYRPEFPACFGSQEDAQAFCEAFFVWYNTEHNHSGIAMLTPETVHTGRAKEEIALREAVLKAAYAAHPERFVRHPPRHPALPEAAWINPPAKDRASAATGAAELQ
jgi:putative transposase